MQILKSISPCILFFFFTTACKEHSTRAIQAANPDTIYIHDTIPVLKPVDDWQKGFGLTHDPEADSIWFKPVSYYINDKNCSGLAVDFYYGRLRPSDDGATTELLKLAATGNDKLRPFYRWCLNKTILVQDGALAELTGIPARIYAEKFPNEFFAYMDIDSSGEKINDWIAAIAYSGFYDEDDHKNATAIRKRFSNTMISHCYSCDKKMLERIDSFATRCFLNAK